jgi:hypothetical protein
MLRCCWTSPSGRSTAVPCGSCQNAKFSMGYVGNVGVLGLLLSATALVATIALWVCLAVISRVNRKDAEPQGLFKLDDSKNNPT